MTDNKLRKKQRYYAFERLDFLLTAEINRPFEVYFDLTAGGLYFVGQRLVERLPKDNVLLCIYRHDGENDDIEEVLGAIKTQADKINEWLNLTVDIFKGFDVTGDLQKENSDIFKMKPFKLITKGFKWAIKTLMGEYA